MYLFDTFEGFDSRDLIKEKDYSYTKTKFNKFVGTSVELVLSKMEYPSKCIIKKGYFPSTFTDIEESFIFVSIDVDLYKPTYLGLEIFYPRLKEGGIIFVHDYFDDKYLGVKEAVDQYCKENNLYFCPIGDGCSIAIVKS